MNWCSSVQDLDSGVKRKDDVNRASGVGPQEKGSCKDLVYPWTYSACPILTVVSKDNDLGISFKKNSWKTDIEKYGKPIIWKIKKPILKTKAWNRNKRRGKI